MGVKFGLSGATNGEATNTTISNVINTGTFKWTIYSPCNVNTNTTDAHRNQRRPPFSCHSKKSGALAHSMMHFLMHISYLFHAVPCPINTKPCNSLLFLPTTALCPTPALPHQEFGDTSLPLGKNTFSLYTNSKVDNVIAHALRVYTYRHTYIHICIHNFYIFICIYTYMYISALYIPARGAKGKLVNVRDDIWRDIGNCCLVAPLRDAAAPLLLQCNPLGFDHNPVGLHELSHTRSLAWKTGQTNSVFVIVVLQLQSFCHATLNVLRILANKGSTV